MSVETEFQWFAEAVAAQAPEAPTLPPQADPKPTRPIIAFVGGGLVVGMAIGFVVALTMIGSEQSEAPAAPQTTVPTPALDLTETTSTTTTPTTIPPAPTSPSEAFARFLDDWAVEKDQVGISASVIGPDGSFWAEGAGYANQEEMVVVDPSDRFQAGSITKTFVSVTTLRLAEEGLIDLDATIDRHLPDFPGSDQITVRHLLGHRAGVFDAAAVLVSDLTGPPDPQRVFTIDEILAASEPGTPVFTPGSRHDYSNGNYIVLGAVLEAATGETAADLVDRYIAQPLGLANTVLYDERLPAIPVVNAYTDLDLDGVPDATGTAPMVGFITPAWTAGSLITTASDLAVFLDAVFSGDLLTAESFESLLDTSSGGPGYGLGIYRVGGLWGHDGGIKGYLAAVFHDPESGITVATMTNHFGPNTPQADAAAFDLMDLALELFEE